MSWTDERVELLKKLWADGLSASQIAAELGGITRNAVIGKRRRTNAGNARQHKQKKRDTPHRPSDPRQTLAVYAASARRKFVRNPLVFG